MNPLRKPAATGGEPLSPRQRARFEASVLPHLDAAYNLARHLMLDVHDAEDAVQESLLRAVRHIDSLRGTDGRPWLLAIVRNACFTQLRRRRSKGEFVEFDETVHGGDDGRSRPETDWARTASRESLQEALGRLPAEFREALVLRELEDLSYKEIAEVAGVPIGTVMSRIARARRHLMRLLHDAPGGGSLA